MDFILMTITTTIGESTLKAIIKDIKKSTIVATGEKFIDVEVWIYQGDEKVDVKKFGYPYNATEEEIVADVKKHIELRKSETVQKENQEIEETEEKAVDVEIEKLQDLEIN